MKLWQHVFILLGLVLTLPALGQDSGDRADQQWDQQYGRLLKTRPGLQDKIDRGETTKDEVIAWLKWRSERSGKQNDAGQAKPDEKADPDRRPKSDESISFQHGDMQRSYLVHLPDNLQPNAPLVFLLHGYHGKAKNVTRMGMNALADKNGFAVCYPQGADDWEGIPHWNARLKISQTDDIGFLSALAKQLQQQYKLNPDKTFVCGVSNGGYMSYTLVAERPDVFKAAASLIGTMSGETWKRRDSIKPMPVMQVSGLADRVVPIDGTMKEAGGWGGAPHQDQIIDFWKQLNKTTTEKVIKVSDQTTGYRYGGGTDGNEVWYYTVKGLGHSVPGKRKHGISSIELVWEFFSRY